MTNTGNYLPPLLRNSRPSWYDDCDEIVWTRIAATMQASAP